VTIRPARREDLPALLALLRDDALAAFAEPPDEPAHAAALDEILASPSSELLVVEEDGRVAGSCQLDFLRRLARRGGLTMEIESVHVHSSVRGRGLGAALIRAALARARARGCSRVQLTSQLRRTDARRFYERLGFAASHAGFKLAL
jgi:GNAT superfamily N-acetyltransferase